MPPLLLLSQIPPRFFTGENLNESDVERFYDMTLHEPMGGHGAGSVVRPFPRRNLASLINGVNECNASKYALITIFDRAPTPSFVDDVPNLKAGRVLVDNKLRIFLSTTKKVKKGDVAVYKYSAGMGETASFANNEATHCNSPDPVVMPSRKTVPKKREGSVHRSGGKRNRRK